MRTLKENKMFNIEKLETLPFRMNSKMAIRMEDYYQDFYKKSSSEKYETTTKIVEDIYRKYHGESSTFVEKKLKKIKGYTHNHSIKECVNDSLKYDFYDKGKYSDIFITKDYKIEYLRFPKMSLPKKKLPDIPKRTKLFSLEKNGSLFYIMRKNGIHYFIKEAYYKDKIEREKPWFNSFRYVAPLLSSYDKEVKQLSKKELKFFNLKNIW